MTVPTRAPTFTPPGRFSWARAAAVSAGVHALTLAALTGFVALAGFGLLVSRSDTVLTPGYTLLAWAALQGVYPLYHRATGAPDDHIPQSPRFLRLLLMSQAIGLLLFSLAARPLAGLYREPHPVGSLTALMPESGTAFAVFLLYTVGMLGWPCAALLFMFRSVARPGTAALGLAVGLPAFIIALPGGLVAGGLRLLAEHIDLDAELTVWGTYGVTGLIAYAAVLVWYARSVRREPLGPPPAKRNLLGGAVTSR